MERPTPREAPLKLECETTTTTTKGIKPTSTHLGLIQILTSVILGFFVFISKYLSPHQKNDQ
jgi:hypothetical protein